MRPAIARYARWIVDPPRLKFRSRINAPEVWRIVNPAPAAVEFLIAGGRLPMDRVTFHNYESGHMLYLGGTAEAFANDVRNFILGAK